jgi:hypothetical protein
MEFSMSARIGRRRLARLSTELSERDFEVLHSVASHRFLSAKQIERLHFHDHASRLTAARVCRRVLARMVRDRLLARLERRAVGGLHAGSASYIYCIGPAGRRLRAEGGIRQAREPAAAFLEHTLAVAEVHIELREAARTDRFELLGVEVEPASWRHYLNSGGGRETLRPDLYAVSARGEYEYCWFLEIDRGREGPSALTRKCRQYETYWRSGNEQQRSGTFPLVVWVAPDDNRASALERTIRSARLLKQELFRVVTHTELVELFAGSAA